MVPGFLNSVFKCLEMIELVNYGNLAGIFR